MTNYKMMIENVINRGNFDLEGMLNRIERAYLESNLEHDERADLIDMARNKAKPQESDLQIEVQKIWSAINEIRAQINTLAGYHEHNDEHDTEDDGDNEQDAVHDIIDDWHPVTGAHDAYYNGMLMRYTDGFVYRCTAPQGAACVWSPSVMPTYWEVIPDA